MATSPTTILGLCSGVGMLEEACAAACGGVVLAHVEWESYAAACLLARMEEQSLEPAPVWCGDLGGFDGRPFRGLVDILCAGLPCQPYSRADQLRCGGNGVVALQAAVAFAVLSRRAAERRE